MFVLAPDGRDERGKDLADVGNHGHGERDADNGKQDAKHPARRADRRQITIAYGCVFYYI